MKNIIIILLLSIFNHSYAQKAYSTIYGNLGIIGKRTLTLEEAKGIKGVDAFYISAKGEVVSVEVYSYMLLVVSGTDTSVYVNNNGRLTTEMQQKLNQLKSPCHLVFQEIIARFPESGERQNLTYIPIDIK